MVRVAMSPTSSKSELSYLTLPSVSFYDCIDAIRKKAWPILVGIDDAETWSASSTSGRHKANKSSSYLRGRSGPTTGGAPQSSMGARPAVHANRELPRVPPRPPVNPRSNDDDDYTLVSATSMASLSSQVTTVTSHTTAPPLPPPCLDEAQVARDVARCTWHLLTGSQRAQRLQMEYKRNRKVARHIHKKQDKLGRLICDTLVTSYETPNPLRYYQGYHDVACIVLSTLQDTKLASRVLLQISYSHLRDCCNPDFQSLQEALHLAVMPMLRALDPLLFRKLQSVDMTPYFCLSWILTWFAHDVRDTALVKRLFDAFLASHAMMPTYVAVAMLIRNRREILDCEDDFSQLHQCLCGLPKNSSRVGWKYRPGEGYVTDEEHGGTTVSTTSSMGTADFLLVAAAEEAEHHDFLSSNGAPTTLLSSISSLEEASISFEHLIQEAIGIMMQIPPSRIVVLKEHVRRSRWLSSLRAPPTRTVQTPVPLPRMLQEPPFWSVRQFLLRSSTGIPPNRRTQGRKHRSRSRSHNRVGASASSSVITEEERLEVQEYLKKNTNSLAVIAAGYGSGRFRGGSSRVFTVSTTGAVILTVAVVAVAFGFLHKSHQQQPSWEQNEPALRETNGYLVAPPAFSTDIILAVSGEVNIYDASPKAVHCEHGTGFVNGISGASVENRTSPNTISFVGVAPKEEIEITAVSLRTQLSPQDYYLSELSDYKALIAAFQRLIHGDFLVVRRVWSIAASKTEPFVNLRVRDIHSVLIGWHRHLKLAFDESSLSNQVSFSYNRSIVVLKQGNDLAKRYLNRVSKLAEGGVGQLVIVGELLRVDLQPRFQEVAVRATGVFRWAEDAVKQRGRSILTKLGTSKAGYRWRHMIRFVSMSPVTHKFLELSVALLTDASLSKYYG
jgi:Rab-GTPase-TBC domain